MKKYMVIDGNSIINRAFYGLPPMNAEDGRPTNALVGFFAILHRLLKAEEPNGVCVCFDLHAPTFRHKMYSGYKATRHGTPPELIEQIPMLKELLDGMDIPRYELEGYEADDLLGTISRRVCEGGDSCLLVTGDRDSLQLVGNGTILRYISTGNKEDTLYDALRISIDYGVEPTQLIDVKSLMGDTSDNIPGVKGVGEKTALSLIQSYGDLEGVYAHLDELRPVLRQKLENDRENALMSLTLARIERNAPLEFTPSELDRPIRTEGEIYDAMRSLSLNTVISKFGIRPAAEKESSAVGLTVARVEDGLEKGWAYFEGEDGLYSSDGERVCRSNDRPCDLFDGGTVWYSKPMVKAALEKGEKPPCVAFDVLLAAYVLNLPTELFSLCERLLNVAPDSPAASALALARLRPLLESRIKEEGLEFIYYSIELPLAGVLAEMEHAGFAVDRDSLLAFGEGLEAEADTLKDEIYSLAGHEFNINSPKQLSVVLFEELGLPAGKKTRTGYSTDIDVLKHLTSRHPIVEKILRYRGFTKLRSTYVEGLEKQISADGRIHCHLNQTGTVTGRISSSEPNLQNTPVRSDPGSELRGMFIAGEGMMLADADYSQIELRVLSHVAGDELMMKAFNEGADIHRATAALVCGVEPDEVTPAQRSAAKAVNFGIVYGISDFSLADDIDSTRAYAKELIDAYLSTYSGVRDYMQATVEFAREKGYVSTMFGRRRYIPEIKHSNFNLRKAAERIAYNTPIQGTAADIIKLAMVNVSRRLKAEGLQTRLILQVHDELITEGPAAEAESALEILTSEMARAATLAVPLNADGSIGRSWKEAKA